VLQQGLQLHKQQLPTAAAPQKQQPHSSGPAQQEEAPTALPRPSGLEQRQRKEEKKWPAKAFHKLKHFLSH